MSKSINDKVDRAFKEGVIKLTTEEILLVSKIILKHNADMSYVTLITALLQIEGFGRNSKVANALRAIAEIIESPLTTAETTEAKLDNKLQ